MGEKSKYLIIVVVALILVIGVMAYTNFSQDRTAKVGDLNFNIPNGYSEGVLNHVGDVNLTDGKHYIGIGKLSGVDAHKYIKEYVDDRLKHNDSILSSNMTVDNQFVYKCLNKNTGATHYWFVSNGNVYTIYSWGKIDNMDTIVSDLIKSMHP